MHTLQDNIKKNGSPYLVFLFKSLACFYMDYLGGGGTFSSQVDNKRNTILTHCETYM